MHRRSKANCLSPAGAFSSAKARRTGCLKDMQKARRTVIPDNLYLDRPGFDGLQRGLL